MDWQAIPSRFEHFGMSWKRVMLRGAGTCLIGFALALAALFNPNAMLLHASEFSWLPAGGLVLGLVGLLECLDAAIAREPRDFFLHLQNGILDVVVGALIILSLGGDPARLSLLLAGFLIVKGIFRLVLAQAMNLRQKTTALVGGGISVLLGLLIWAEWPSVAAWFLAFCLGAEIGLRGWSLMQLGHWLKARPGDS
ncbi:HdeD family acid-resistance protein [Methylomagnum sp.]